MNKKIFLILLCNLIFSIYASEQIIWELALPGKVIANPKEKKTGEMIVICEDRRVYSIDNKTGGINWKIKPGGRLINFFLAPDGSIITYDEGSIYSIYGNGKVRWTLPVSGGFQSNLSINDRSDIFFVSNNNLYITDRYGKKRIVKKGIIGQNIATLNNSLIAYSTATKLYAISFSGRPAWEVSLTYKPSQLQKSEKGLHLISPTGTVDTYSYAGNKLGSIQSNNNNSYSASLNSSGNLIIYGDKGVSLITKDGAETQKNDSSFGLYYSDGVLIKSYDDWTIKGIEETRNSNFYPSGLKQKIGNVISLSSKKVWEDELKREYYNNTILSNNRELQKQVLKQVDNLLGDPELLDTLPNFYEILLIASSKKNKNQDTRQEAYRLIGKSKDINFTPYLQSDLEGETSFHVLTYIFYALGQLSVDRTGLTIEGINKKIDDYFDEKMAINGLYALYYINQYNNGEYIEHIFFGIEKVINGGYSRKIQKQCYEILEKVK